MAKDLFIGITTWNSAAFLPTALTAIRRRTDERTTRLVILDNFSNDASVAIARSYGAKVVQRASSQSMAVGDLFNFSKSEFTLLIHADVVLMNDGWLDACARHLTGNVALVSPEDIGCGPYTRPWGTGMPESSFLFFRTALGARTRIWHRRQRFKMILPFRALDLNGDHLTYNLPPRLAEKNLAFKLMKVHASSRVETPIYEPHFNAPAWKAELAMHRYGLGNFYSIDGVVTHYHNWFERMLDDVDLQSERTMPPESGGLPLAFLKVYSRRFLDDFARDAVDIPEVSA
jgi:glycosyltransferase involved in cell wall biosynthesis